MSVHHAISHYITEINRQAIRGKERRPTLFVIGSCPRFEVRLHTLTI